jgi:hypothetical protein
VVTHRYSGLRSDERVTTLRDDVRAREQAEARAASAYARGWSAGFTAGRAAGCDRDGAR